MNGTLVVRPRRTFSQTRGPAFHLGPGSAAEPLPRTRAGIGQLQPGYCLVLRPFNAPSDRAWGAIKQQLELSFRWTDVRDLSESGSIMSQILTEIARTDVVIVDITGNNPNVFFELGIARTAKPERKVLIVKREGDEDDRPATSITGNESVVPFDVRSDRYLSFRTTDDAIQAMLPTLRERLLDALEKSQWFRLGKGEVFVVGPLEGADGRGTFLVDVQPKEFLETEKRQASVYFERDPAIRLE